MPEVSEPETYNPLDKNNLGRSVAEAMLEQQVQSLDGVNRFKGAGIYAIYYTGRLSCYKVIAEQNRGGKFQRPIYVGKAVPSGARKGDVQSGGVGTPLFTRIKQHAQSVREAENLNIADFHCRYLVVEDIWIPLGESLLIARFSPVWNKLVDGFGNHDPGSGRHKGMRSRWDTLHPGRSWVPQFELRNESAEEIAKDVVAYLAAMPEPVAHMLGPSDDNGYGQGK
jgi:hypothetical protein